MSEGSTPRGRTTVRAGVTDRPARIQELREAAGDDDVVPSPATSIGHRAVGVDGAPTGVDPHRPAPTAVVAPAPVPASPSTGRTGLVFVVVAAIVLAVVGGFIVFGRSSAPAVSAAPTEPAAVSVAPTVAEGEPERLAAEARTADLCEAADTYSVDDLLQLGSNLAARPDAFLAAYETLLVNAPADLRPLLDRMGPLTRKAVAEVKDGNLTSDVEVQAWLAGSPAAELEAWVAPQQALAPRLGALCTTS